MVNMLFEKTKEVENLTKLLEEKNSMIFEKEQTNVDYKNLITKFS